MRELFGTTPENCAKNVLGRLEKINEEIPVPSPFYTAEVSERRTVDLASQGPADSRKLTARLWLSRLAVNGLKKFE